MLTFETGSKVELVIAPNAPVFCEFMPSALRNSSTNISTVAVRLAGSLTNV